MTQQSTMSREFHDWLDQCPCQWFRDSNPEPGKATYTFIEDEEDYNENPNED